MVGSINIYTDHFGLTERPFTLVPDPDFLFWSRNHKHTYTMLEYGLMTKAPITLITGEVGAGKTTLLHYLLKDISEEIVIGLISNAHGDGERGELLRWVLLSLDQDAPREATYVELFNQFQQYLIAEYSKGRRIVLIFDEAQNLSARALEELRMYTNINSNKDELLQLILVGQPELRDIIRGPELKQFAQRVSANFHLSEMDADAVYAYIAHRLRKAGAPRMIFTREACALIHLATNGTPRLVNQLCDFSLVYASSDKRKTVNEGTVRNVLNDGIFFPPYPLELDKKTNAN